MIDHIIAISLALLIDAIIGDPVTWPHPVRWIGSGINKLEKALNKQKRRKEKGLLMVLIIITATFLITFTLVWVLYLIHPVVGVIGESMMIATTIARKGLKDAGLSVYHPLEKGELQEARQHLSYIVARDTAQLHEAEMVRATVETVAENTSDGVTAPLFWGLIGGAPLAMVYRAINTCDSMVGYQNEQFHAFGWASAKIDDIVNWIPSRFTAYIMLLGHKPASIRRKQAFKKLFCDAKKHPSPNSGWLEAAVAILLGVQLGGTNYYKGIVSERAKMGEAIFPLQREHIVMTNKLLDRTTWLFLIALCIGGIVIEFTATWIQSTLFI